MPAIILFVLWYCEINGLEFPSFVICRIRSKNLLLQSNLNHFLSKGNISNLINYSRGSNLIPNLTCLYIVIRSLKTSCTFQNFSSYEIWKIIDKNLKIRSLVLNSEPALCHHPNPIPLQYGKTHWKIYLLT